jgi:hypothetical protein
MSDKPLEMHTTVVLNPSATPTPQAQAGDIPAGVYYSTNTGNFHDAVTRKGMGNDFFNEWHLYTDRFPRDLPQAPAREAGAVDDNSGINWDVVRRSYGFIVADDGELHGLTAGDHHYEPTGLVIDMTGWYTHPAAASDDARRLDWLVSMWAKAYLSSLASVIEAFRTGEPATVRAAIDAAMQRQSAALSSPDGLRKGEVEAGSTLRYDCACGDYTSPGLHSRSGTCHLGEHDASWTANAAKPTKDKP